MMNFYIVIATVAVYFAIGGGMALFAHTMRSDTDKSDTDKQ